MLDFSENGVHGKMVTCLPEAAISTNFRATKFVIFYPKIAY